MLHKRQINRISSIESRGTRYTEYSVASEIQMAPCPRVSIASHRSTNATGSSQPRSLKCSLLPWVFLLLDVRLRSHGMRFYCFIYIYIFYCILFPSFKCLFSFVDSSIIMFIISFFWYRSFHLI